MLSLLGRLVWGWGSRRSSGAEDSGAPGDALRGEEHDCCGASEDAFLELPLEPNEPEEACNPIAHTGVPSCVRSVAASICPSDGGGGGVNCVYRLLDAEPEFFAHRTARYPQVVDAAKAKRAMACGEEEEMDAGMHRRIVACGVERQNKIGMGRSSSQSSMTSSSAASTTVSMCSSDGGGHAHKFYRLLDIDPELRAVF